MEEAGWIRSEAAEDAGKSRKRVYEVLAAGREELARWALDGLLILHRHGQMTPGDPIVLVAAAARHRRDAFAAADFAMDHLKSDSWFWKRERRGGEWRWIEPRDQDHADLARWG